MRTAGRFVAIVLALHANAALGEGSGSTLTLEDALARAQSYDPRIKGATFDLRASEAAVEQAGAAKNPELSITGENLLGNGAYQGAARLETTIEVSQTLNTSGSASARRQLAETHRSVAGLGIEVARLEVVEETRRAFVEVLAAQRLLAVSEQALAEAKELQGLVERRQRSGAAGSPAEGVTVGLDAERADLRLEQARAELQVALRRLGMRWGEVSPSFAGVAGELTVPKELATFEALVARLGGNISSAQASAAAASLRAEVAVEEAAGGTDLTVSVGLRHFREEGKVAAVVGASIPLPVFDRNAAGARAASERAQRAGSAVEAGKLAAMDGLSRAHGRLVALRGEAERLASRLLPEARKASSILEKAFRQGASSYLELSAARRVVLELAAREVDVAREFHELSAKVEHLTASAAK